MNRPLTRALESDLGEIVRDVGRWLRRCLAQTLVYLLVALGFLAVVLFAPRTAHAQVPPAAAHYRADLVRAAHSQWGLDAPIAALAAQVHQESAWNPQAVSRVGARGLAQFMPATARWWCEINGLSADAAAPGRPKQGSAPSGGSDAHEVASVGAPSCQPHNPTWALRALVGYDRWLYQRTPLQYSAHDRMWVALRAYNGGLGNWRAEARNAQGWVDQAHTRQAVDAVCGTARRHPLHCAENLGYPARILKVLQPRYATWGPLL